MVRTTRSMTNAARRRWLVLAGVLAVALLIAVVLVAVRSRQPAPPAVARLPLRPVGEIALPGDGSRFDYTSRDAGHGLLFVAHLGAGEVIEADLRAQRIVRVIPDLSGVHGVLAVPALHRVYATATGANQMVSLDEDTGAALARTPTGHDPDGLAFDPRRGAIWTTNQAGDVGDAVAPAVDHLWPECVQEPIPGQLRDVLLDLGTGPPLRVLAAQFVQRVQQPLRALPGVGGKLLQPGVPIVHVAD